MYVCMHVCLCVGVRIQGRWWADDCNVVSVFGSVVDKRSKLLAKVSCAGKPFAVQDMKCNTYDLLLSE